MMMARICCSWPWALMVLVAYAVDGAQAAGSGDEFSNNLFTDLAPLLSLFGEQFAKQFMSVSMGWLDHIVFAMAPLGIITALAAAIRVGGPAWLKAVIGRARENRAIVELELMSSTSHEVCELWNGQGIVRTMGTPEIQEIIYLEDHHNDTDTFGLYTLDSAKAHGLLRERDLRDPLPKMLWGGQANTDEEQPDTTHEKRGHLPPPKSAPNISLNLHGGSSVSELLWAAFCGTVLQSGVLVFAGFSVYHPRLRRNFSNAEDVEWSSSMSYAYPIMAGGTILLTLGLVICLAVVDNSTEEKEFVAVRQKSPNNASAHDDEKLRARILWLQRSHVVNDQAFNATVIFRTPESENTTLDSILTSRRAGISAKWQTTGFLTILGVFLGLCGFILQFQGLRGLHWSVSIAQLGCIMLMTALRAWLRRHLIVAPIPKQVPTQHELDWLALWLAKQFEKDGRRNLWPISERILEKDAENMRCRLLNMINLDNETSSTSDIEHQPHQNQVDRETPSDERFIWKIKTGPTYRTRSDAISGNIEGEIADPLIAGAQTQASRVQTNTTIPNSVPPPGLQQPVIRGPPKGSSRAAGSCSSAAFKQAQRTMKIRQRLAQLTRWTGEAGLAAVSIAQSISSTLDMLFTKAPGDTESFSWSLEVQLDDCIELIEFCASKHPEEGWAIDATQIEAVLSLWLFHLNEIRVMSQELRAGKEEEKKGSGKINDWLQKDVGSTRRVIRMLGPDSPCLNTDICWWLGSNNIGISLKTVESWPWKVNNVAISAQNDFQGPIGFAKCDENVDAALDKQKILTVEATGSLVNLLAQHIFTAFMWAVATDQRLNIDRAGTTSVASHDFRVEDPNTLLSVRLENRILSDLARRIEGTGLCNSHEAYLCIIPSLSAAKSLPALELVGFVREKTRNFEYVGKWNIVVPIYIRLFQELNAGKKTGQEFFQACIILIETLISITGIIKLQSEQHDRSNIDALEQLASNIQKELKELPINMREGFARIYKVQGRFYGDIWQQLEIIEESLPQSRVREMYANPPENSESLYGMFEKEPVYSKMVSITPLLTIQNIKPHENPIANTTAVDIFGWTPLHYSALLPDMTACIAIQAFLGYEDVNVNAIDMMGRTPLCNAVAHSASQGEGLGEKKVTALIRAGANLNTTARNGRSPLHYAAEGGSSTLTALLLSEQAKIELQDHLGQRPIHLAAFGGHCHVFALLLAKGAYIGVKDHYGRTPLHLAALVGKDEMLKKILAIEDVEWEPKDRWGRTPLDLAGLSGNIQSFTTLFRNTVQIEEEDDDDITTENSAFLYAVRSGKINIVQKWLKTTPKGTNLLECSDSEGSKALHLAARYGHVSLLLELLIAGVAVDTENLDGITAVHVAAQYGQVGSLRLLTNRGASLERRTSGREGFTALHIAAMYEQCDALVELLRAGVPIDITTEVHQLTPLHIAARHGNLQALHLLILRGASPEAITIHSDRFNRRGFNALHIAAKYGHCDVMVELLAAGTSIDTKTARQGLTPLHIAARHNQEEAVGLLIGRCASLDEMTTGYYQDSEGYNALHIATIHGNFTIVHNLLVFGFPVDTKTPSEGHTALHIAVLKNQLDIVRILIHHGANLEASNDSGFKPLYLAAMKGDRYLVQCLLKAKADPESRIDLKNIRVSCHRSNINVCPDALSVAASYGHSEVVGILRSAGAELNNKKPFKIQITSLNVDGQRRVGLYSGALMAAACGGHLDTVRYLIRNGAEFPNITFSTIKVCQVTLEGNAEVVMGFGDVQIEDFSAKGHAKFNIYRTMLSAAVSEGYTTLVYNLVTEFRVPVNPSGENIMGFLGRVQITREFSMSDAAQVNIDYANLQFQNARVTISGTSTLNAYRGPLLAAIRNRDSWIVDFLLNSGVNPNWNPAGFVNSGTGTAAVETEYFHLRDRAIVNLDCSTFSLKQTSEFQDHCALNIYSGPLSAAALCGDSMIVENLLRKSAENTRPDCNVIQPYIKIGKLYVFDDAMEAAEASGKSDVVMTLGAHRMKKQKLPVFGLVPGPVTRDGQGQVAEPSKVEQGQKKTEKKEKQPRDAREINVPIGGGYEQEEERGKQHLRKKGAQNSRSHSVRFEEDEEQEEKRPDEQPQNSGPSTAHNGEVKHQDDDNVENPLRRPNVYIDSEDDEEGDFLRSSSLGTSEGRRDEDEESTVGPRGVIMLPWYDSLGLEAPMERI